jgi:hypothetical protein
MILSSSLAPVALADDGNLDLYGEARAAETPKLKKSLRRRKLAAIHLTD